jgi:predicted nucleic acid-binding protein
MSKKGIICDTDFLISLHITNETTHQKALGLYEKYQDYDFYISNLTKYEIATVLSRKFDHNSAKQVLELIQDNFNLNIWFEKEFEIETFKIYNNQTNKNISFFDCSCLFLANKFDWKIASFDSFYPNEKLIV